MELLNIINAVASNKASQVELTKELDYIASIEHSCQRLNLDLKENLFNNDDYLNYFLTIDDKTRIIVEKLTESYLKIDIINQQYKSRMASAVFLHHRLMFAIYFKLIVSLAPSKHPQLGKLIGRAINNATEIIKWRYFNFQGAPGNVWLQLANLYDMAEKSALTNKKIAFYPELQNAQYVPNTIASSFIMINMLGSLESLSFKPQQVDFLSKILSKWTGEISIDKQYDDKKHLFSVNLEKNHPAKRIRNHKKSISNRYWCMDTINVKIQIFMNCIEHGRKPRQKAMKALINHIFAQQTFQMIRKEWSLSEYKRQRRAYPRNKTNKDAINVFGFEDTYYQVKHYEDSIVKVTKGSFSNPDQSDADDNDKQTHLAESMTTFVNENHGFCNIVDESLNGLCMHVEKKPSELTIGMMLGIAIKDNRFGTKIGIIRSIRTTENNTLRIGVEIISRNAFSITGHQEQMATTNQTNASSAASADNNVVFAFKNNRENTNSITELMKEHTFGEEQDTFNCLFLPKEFSFNKGQTLIIPKQRYMENGQYQMMVSKDEKLVQLNDAVEQHDNWVRVHFSEVNTDATQ